MCTLYITYFILHILYYKVNIYIMHYLSYLYHISISYIIYLLSVVNCGNGLRMSVDFGWLPSSSLSPHSGEETKQAERLTEMWYFCRTCGTYICKLHKVVFTGVARRTKWMVKANGTCGSVNMPVVIRRPEKAHRRHHSLGHNPESKNCSINI